MSGSFMRIAQYAERMSRWRSLAGTAVVLGVLGVIGCSDSPSTMLDRAAAPPETAARLDLVEVATLIRDHLPSAVDPILGVLSSLEQADLATLYEPGAHAPLWIDSAGGPSRSAREALALIDRAEVDGLDPNDYAASLLGQRATVLEREDSPSPADAAAFDMAMSAAVLRYFRHLHLGRVDPRSIGFTLNVPAHGHDMPALLRSALGDQRIKETAAGLAPRLVQYRLLRDMLGRYRAFAEADADPLTLPAETMRPGESHAGLDALRRRLATLGDLPPAAPADESLYEGSLVDGVKRFQIRHGLEADGIVGGATQTALRIPLPWRVRQIELALERLRWLPDLGGRRFLALNIPMFHLWGWDSVPPSGAPSFGMRAIVGRALSTETPVFVEDMRYVIFRPYWNVPLSILRNEILPALDRDPGYLRREDMEIVRGLGDNAPPVEATPENLARLRQGALRLRQRPGPGNALGLAKFVFPNDENIYLHGTPAQDLFSRSRRDFSHGCVRVEDPVALAEWVLKDRPEWTRDRILAAMGGPQSQQVTLAQPIQVILFYMTAAVMPEDGTIRFAEDIYRHDERLDRALIAVRGRGRQAPTRD